MPGMRQGISAVKMTPEVIEAVKVATKELIDMSDEEFDEMINERMGPDVAITDRFSWHEALDRTHVIASTFDDHVVSHPVISDNSELREQAEKAVKEMAELYQMIGRRMPQ